MQGSQTALLRVLLVADGYYTAFYRFHSLGVSRLDTAHTHTTGNPRSCTSTQVCKLCSDLPHAAFLLKIIPTHQQD